MPFSSLDYAAERRSASSVEPRPCFSRRRRLDIIARSQDTNDRQVRAAKNQALFREINERIESLNEDFSAITSDGGEWVCECANESCVALVQMSVAEYEAVRAKPNRFFVAAADDHIWADVERVVQRTERYWIVEKIGAGADVATQTYPRT